MASFSDLPKPKTITGGYLCAAIRYRVDFPEEYDFMKNGELTTTHSNRFRSKFLTLAPSLAAVNPLSAADRQVLSSTSTSVLPSAAFKWLYPGDDTQPPSPIAFSQPPPAFKTFSTQVRSQT